eukprot:Em0022g741a
MPSHCTFKNKVFCLKRAWLLVGEKTPICSELGWKCTLICSELGWKCTPICSELGWKCTPICSELGWKCTLSAQNWAGSVHLSGLEVYTYLLRTGLEVYTYLLRTGLEVYTYLLRAGLEVYTYLLRAGLECTPICSELGWKCVPLVVETFSAWGRSAGVLTCEVCDNTDLWTSRSLILFQGIAMPAFIANTSADPIAMFEMPAFCNRDFRSSSLSVSTSFSIRADGSPPLMMLLHLCTPGFTVVEQAAVVRCPAFVSNSNVIFDAGLISLGTKEPSSEQQGHTWSDLSRYQGAVLRAARTHRLMLLPAPQPILCRPAYDMAVQGAMRECLNTLLTSTHSGQSHCFGLSMVGRAHVRRLEEGQSSKDAQ